MKIISILLALMSAYLLFIISFNKPGEVITLADYEKFKQECIQLGGTTHIQTRLRHNLDTVANKLFCQKDGINFELRKVQK